MKVLLVNPPSYKDAAAIAPSYMRSNRAFNYAPLGLLYLAASLSDDFECRVIDGIAKGLTIGEVLTSVREFQPEVIGLTTTSDVLFSCKKLCDDIKKSFPQVKIVIGGPHATIFPSETISFDSVDFVLTGYSETSFPKLMNVLHENPVRADKILEGISGLWWKRGKEIKKSPIAVDPAWDIKEMPLPDRTLVDWSDYFVVTENETATTMVSTRGCPFRCTFCDIPEKSFLTRDVDDLISEIKEARELGIRHYHFFDDVFNLQRNRVVKICERLIEENLGVTWSFRGRIKPCDDELAALLSRAGCTRVQLGVESSSQKTIDIIKKQIRLSDLPDVLRFYRRHGIQTLGYFIIGFAHQTYDEVIEELAAVRRLGFDYVNMFVLIPYPNTAVYREILDKGYLDRDYWLEHARNPVPHFTLPEWHPHLTSDQLQMLLNKFYRGFYLTPRFVLKEIDRGVTVNRFLKQVKMAFAMWISRKPVGLVEQPNK